MVDGDDANRICPPYTPDPASGARADIIYLFVIILPFYTASMLKPHD